NFGTAKFRVALLDLGCGNPPQFAHSDSETSLYPASLIKFDRDAARTPGPTVTAASHDRRGRAGTASATALDEVGVECEKLACVADPTECETADRDEAGALARARCRDEVRRHQHAAIDRAAHRRNPARLVHRRPDHCEVQTIVAADVAVEDVADVEAQVDRGDGSSLGGAPDVQRRDPGSKPRLGLERPPASGSRIVVLEDRERP